MPHRVLFITGAPEYRSLEWDIPSLLDAFIGPVARFAGIPQAEQYLELSSPEPGSVHAAWRSLQLSREHLPTGFSQIRGWVDDSRDDADFLNPSNLSFASTGSAGDESAQLPSETSTASVEEVASQFYEHSFAIHADVPSSQISPYASQNLSTASFTSTASEHLSRPTLPAGAHLSILSSIPNATHLQSIHPQTMTVNLLVGIVSVSPPRPLTTRRGTAVDIVELLAGDESKSGFGINYWLPKFAPKPRPRVTRSTAKSMLRPGKGQESEETEGEAVRSMLEGLRPQDIVLLTNVALSSFMGRVHGQSLRRGLSKVQLLFRQRVDRFDVGGSYSAADLEEAEGCEGSDDELLLKTRRVREWVVRFVGPGTIVVRKGAGKVKGRVQLLGEVLPPDTQ